MKYLIAATILAFSLTFAAPAEARPRYPRVIGYWSPGLVVQWFGQGRGGPHLTWAGDWVPRHMVRNK